MILEFGPLEKILQQGSSVERTLAVSGKNDGTSLIPMFQIMLKCTFHITVCYSCSGPAERIAEFKNANVGLAVARRKNTTNP